MHVRGFCATAAVWLAACGGNELSHGGAPDHVSTHPRAPTGPVGGDAAVPAADAGSASDAGAPVADASGSDSSPAGASAFCSGAGWSDPERFVLVGSAADSVVLVRANGTRKIVG